MNVIHRLPPWSLTAVTSAAIAWLTLAPHPLPPDMDVPLFEGVDKVVHAIMMGGLEAAICLDLMRKGRRGSWERLRPRGYAVTAIIVSMVGGLIEIIQMAMGMGRGAEWADFAADTIGAIATAIIFALIPWPRSQHRPTAGQKDRGPQ